MSKVKSKKATEILESLSDEEVKAISENIEADELSEESAEGTGGVPDGASKTNQLSIAMHKLAGLDSDQVDFFLKSLDQIGKEADGDNSGKNADSIKMKGTPASITDILKGTIKEDLALVFGGDKTLTEDFKEKIATLFEAAVSARMTMLEEMLIEAYDKTLTEELESINETLTVATSKYLDELAEEWKDENKVAIETTFESEIASDFISGLKQLFDEHYISVPEDKTDIANALAERVEALELSLDAEIKKNRETTQKLREAEKDKLISDYTAKLPVSKAENFRKLSESIDYDGDAENFKKKLEIVKNSHFGSKAKTSGIITEEVSHDPNEQDDVKVNLDPVMKNYVAGLSRTIKS